MRVNIYLLNISIENHKKLRKKILRLNNKNKRRTKSLRKNQKMIIWLGMSLTKNRMSKFTENTRSKKNQVIRLKQR